MKQHNPRFLKIVAQTKESIREIHIDEISDETMLIDVREESEFAQSHAKGSIHIAKGILERDIETHVPDTEQMFVLYCGGGFRSALAAESLQKMGYKNVFSMIGGFRAWIGANRDITKL